MPDQKKGRRRKRGDAMNFAYSGPFSAVLAPKPRVPKSDKRYIPDSPESYTVLDQLTGHTRDVLAPFVGATDRIRANRRKRNSRRGGGRRVEA